MSAGTSFIRLRLHFDYPPPAAVGCRMCWLLVDVNACRVVADLESTIREKFGFSRGSIFNLFIQDCYLPHTESIYIVRDNDDIRVKVESLAQVNGHGDDPDGSREKRRKRQRGSEDDGPRENGVEAKCKKKKKKKRCEEKASEDVESATGDCRSQKSEGKKHTEKKKKKNSCAASPLKTPATVKPAVKGKKKLPASPVKRQNPPSSESSSSSSDEVSKKPASKTPSSTPAASRTPPNTKPTQKKLQPPSSSSSDTETSSDEAPRPTTTDSLLQSTSGVQKPAAEPQNQEEEEEEEEEEEIKLVIKKPLPPGRIFAGFPPQRGRGRGRDSLGGPGPGQQGPPETSRTVRAQNGPESRYSSSKEPSYRTDSLVNKSVVLQNGAESFQKRDYSSMPLLAAPPQVGQKIAFKLLELTENYTPEVSEYKEGKIVSFDPATKQMELELLSASQAPTEPGKFDLVYQNPDGSERVEYAVTRGSQVTERWESLLEPRLII